MDITSIAGVAALAVVLTGVAVSIFKITDDSIKKIISAGIAVVLAVVSKLTGIGFADVAWTVLIIDVLAAILAAKVGYDSIVKPVAEKIKKK